MNMLTELYPYMSPSDDASICIGVPMKYLPLMKKHFRGEFKYRPRGGTYRNTRHSCTMADATSFAVYSLMPETHRMRGFA